MVESIIPSDNAPPHKTNTRNPSRRASVTKITDDDDDESSDDEPEVIEQPAESAEAELSM